MAFYMCPLEYRVRRLFQRSPEKFFRPRQPIAERARRAYQERGVRSKDIRLDVSGPESFRDSRVLHLVLHHFLPLFTGATVQVWPEAMENDHLTVDLTAHLGKKKLNKADIKWGNTLLDIEFTIYPSTEQMEMNWIKSNPKYPGYAGRALAALYNVARDSRLSRIYYYVDPKNSKGRQFYFHMDFGRPVENGASVWEVNLREKEGYPLSGWQLSRP